MGNPVLNRITAAVVAAWLATVPVRPAAADDPFAWLEDIEGDAALAWARAENARSLPRLEGDPRFAPMRAEARAILNSPARIPTGSIHDGYVYNFWQDEVHVRGIWRRASVASYRAGKPQWETLLDVDRLAREEGENWISGQFVCLAPAYRHCMVELSRGGGDTSTWREFDVATRSFVRGGFALADAKSDVNWVDADTLLVGTDWGPGSLTESGYPRTIRAWRRGTPLAAARTLFEGTTQDVAVRSYVDQDGVARPFILRGVSFFASEYYYAPGSRHRDGCRCRSTQTCRACSTDARSSCCASRGSTATRHSLRARSSPMSCRAGLPNWCLRRARRNRCRRWVSAGRTSSCSTWTTSPAARRASSATSRADGRPAGFRCRPAACSRSPRRAAARTTRCCRSKA